MHKLFLLCTFFITSSAAADQRGSFFETLSSSKAIEVLNAENKPPVFFSIGTPMKNVQFVQNLIDEATRFFATTESVNIEIRMYAAVLDKKDWESFSVSEVDDQGTKVPLVFGLTTLVDAPVPEAGESSLHPFGAIIGSPLPIDEDGDGEDDNAITGGNMVLLSKVDPVV